MFPKIQSFIIIIGVKIIINDYSLPIKEEKTPIPIDLYKETTSILYR